MTAVTRKLHDLSAAEMGGAVRSREVDPVDLVGSALARIEGHELEVRAWAYVDAAGAKVAENLFRVVAVLQAVDDGGATLFSHGYCSGWPDWM